MKILTLVKILGSCTLIAGGVTSAVEFSNLNTKRFPTVKIFSKETYQKIVSNEDSNNPTNKNLNIDYYSLPNSQYTTYDLANGLKRNYILFFGSEAYSETTKALYGWDGNFAACQGNNSNYSNSLMLNLYDIFLSDDNSKAVQYGVENVNPLFFNYIDLCSTKEVIDNEQLFYERFSIMGDRNYNGDAVNPANQSREWEINAEDKYDTYYEPVVKGASSYNYAPDNSSYQFRPNNLVDTKYETVYFRDQSIVSAWNDIGDFFSNFLNQKYGVSFSKNGTLLCVKYENNAWSFKSITSFNNVEDQIVDIVKFYNPDYKDNQPNPPSNEQPAIDDTNQQTPPATQAQELNNYKTSSCTRMNVKRDINQTNLENNQKIIKKIEY